METSVIKQFARQYQNGLMNDVIPFWEKYSVDPTYGGYFTCLERDGTIYDTDKFIWLQARQVWMFSRLYNQWEKRDAWLSIAKGGAEFLKAHGRNPDGDWYFSLDRTGKPLVEAYSIFSDCFAVLALAEYAQAAKEDWARELALRTYWRIQERWDNPKGRFNKLVPGARPMLSLALPMITIGLTTEINKLLPKPEFEKIIDQNIQLVMQKFVDRRLKTVFESVSPDGSHPDCFEGRLLNPGHTIEAMWFIMEVARSRNDRDLLEQASETLIWTIERGWDSEYDGIFYFLDYKGFPPERLEWDMKLWWVHLEALYAFALAHFQTGEAIFEEWFLKIHDYTWPRFSDSEFGEWYGYLNRRGEITHTLKGGKWKGCFHVPRALYLCAKLFQEK